MRPLRAGVQIRALFLQRGASLPLHLIHKPVDLLVVHSAELLSSNERRRAVLSQRLSVTIMAMTSVSDRLLANEEALIQRIRLCVQYCLV
jgi:hypothetical protein